MEFYATNSATGEQTQIKSFDDYLAWREAQPEEVKNMSKRHIDPLKIQGVQAKFDSTFFGVISDPSITVEDESQSSLTSCFNSFKDTASEVVFMIQNFNDYLDTVAEAFKQTDENLVAQIKEVKLENNDVRYIRNKNKELVRENSYYNRF